MCTYVRKFSQIRTIQDQPTKLGPRQSYCNCLYSLLSCVPRLGSSRVRRNTNDGKLWARSPRCLLCSWIGYEVGHSHGINIGMFHMHMHVRRPFTMPKHHISDRTRVARSQGRRVAGWYANPNYKHDLQCSQYCPLMHLAMAQEQGALKPLTAWLHRVASCGML